MNILTNLIRDYQRDQWVNYGKNLNFAMAQQELLHDGSIWFFVPGTTTRTDAWVDDNQIQLSTNPCCADEYGVFQPIYLNGVYKVVVRDSHEVPLVTIDVVTLGGWLL